METVLNPRAVLLALQSAQNRHDLASFLDCFDVDYESEQPVHPDRAFRGSDQVRKNWSGMFASMPGSSAELLHVVSEEDTVWGEWRWLGTHHDGTQLDMPGVTIFGVRDGRITWGRLYMEPVQEAGPGIDTTVGTVNP
jgi:ketosteroid isomerase-like protein